MAVHEGHRARMRERIEKYGLNGLQQHEVLEYLLYPFIPRKDTNPIAHALIEEFGSLSEVIDADADRLSKVPNMTRGAALFIGSLGSLFRLYGDDKITERELLNTTAKCVAFARPLMASLPKEEIHLLLKDSAGKLIHRAVVARGTVNESMLYVREVTDLALKNEATSVVLIHNHPSGIPKPSAADEWMTQNVALALTLIGIRLDDHIIVTEKEYYSFFQEGALERLGNSTVSLSSGKVKDIKM